VEACKDIEISKITFIGHSMGGLIIRAALPHLAEYSSKFFTYMTLSSPHLGYIQSQGTLIDTGFWFLRQKSLSLS